MDPKAGGGEEDDCADSGAETGGSDYSHLSSTSSELSVEEAQDPFLVSIHIIADPGESQPLQEAIDKVLAWIHPDLPLFRVSERRARRRRRKPPKGAQPALAVVLFLQEEYGEEQILQLHRTLQRPPWRHHHTERVHGRFLPYLPCSQDFFTLAPGTPLWAIRPVHYGKEIVRFTIYCRHDSYADSLRFYELILRRSPSQRKTDFCIFPIFSNLDVDIQFSLKRLPCDQSPIPTDSSLLEFRVKDMGELVPLLPNPCSPISEGRWQTEDHDGNKILLQVPKAHRKSSKPGQVHHSDKMIRSSPLPSATSQSHGSILQSSIDSTLPGPSWMHLPPQHQQELVNPASSPQGSPWCFQRSKSLFCLPTDGPSPASSSEPQWLSSKGPRASERRHSQPFSIDDLEGAQETDVDTGLRLSSSDLSVVSAYSAPSRFCNTAEMPVPSESCNSHWPRHEESREGLPHAVSKATKGVSWVSVPFFSTGSSSSSVTAGAAAPDASTSSLPRSPPEHPCDAPQLTQTGRTMPPLPVLADPGENDVEEFYI